MESTTNSTLKHKIAFIVVFSLIISSIIIGGCNSSKTEENKTTSDKTSSQDDRLDWFKNAKFGMFIHWGPYSQLAGEWNGRKVPPGDNAEWIMKDLQIPVNEYRELARKFNPVKFDAKEWVKVAKAAGMKYIVITSKHHDGFAMYKSGVSEYNIVDWTPFKRDPLKELSEACAAEGIKFCVYYSHREDWDHPGGYGNNWEYDNDWGDNLYSKEKFEKYLEEKAKPQLRELLNNYGPIGLVWFDRGLYTPEQGNDFVNLIHDIQPATLINGRVGHYNQEFLADYQSMSDNGMPPGGLEEYWESPQTLNGTWGYSKHDLLWKSPETIIIKLVEIASRGGNYLLNIGPDGNGEIPDTTLQIFKKVGSWVERNAESIYGTTANPFGELPWGYCTIKDNKIYVFVREWPLEKTISLSGLKNKVTSAYLLVNKTTILDVEQTANLTRIKLPEQAPDSPVSVLVLETDDIPKVDPPKVVQDSVGKMVFNYLTANTTGKTLTRFNRKGGFHISKWTTPEDAVEWTVNITKPGKFRMDIKYAANKEWEGKTYEINFAGSHIEKSVLHTGSWYDYSVFPLGYIEINSGGEYKLMMRPKENSSPDLMYLNSITLTPVTEIKTEGWGVAK